MMRTDHRLVAQMYHVRVVELNLGSQNWEEKVKNPLLRSYL